MDELGFLNEYRVVTAMTFNRSQAPVQLERKAAKKELDGHENLITKTHLFLTLVPGGFPVMEPRNRASVTLAYAALTLIMLFSGVLKHAESIPKARVRFTQFGCLLGIPDYAMACREVSAKIVRKHRAII